ncbi:hypothetical protein HDU84_004689 [Entophlyctis sp. JEL0112]|nr:hypothetical protein HDU84_004689 [Entophlyctis sp. JEL0112]
MLSANSHPAGAAATSVSGSNSLPLLLVLSAAARRLIPVVLGLAGVSLLALAVPVALAVSPAVLAALSPVAILIAAAVILLFAMRARLSPGSMASRAVDGFASLLPGGVFSRSTHQLAPRSASSYYSRAREYAVSWIPSFLRGNKRSEDVTADSSRFAEEGIAPPSDFGDSAAQQSQHQPPQQWQEYERVRPPKDTATSPESRNATIATPLPSSVPVNFKTVFKVLDSSSDAQLLAICTSLFHSTSGRPVSAKIGVRLGRSDTFSVEFKVLSVWRHEVKDLLVQRDFSRLSVRDLVAFVEYMHPIQSAEILRIEKLVTNPAYHISQVGLSSDASVYSQQLIKEMQRFPKVTSIGVWCLNGAEEFYRSLGFAKARDGISVMMESPSTILPVTVDSSTMISSCRPLPEDIATLDDADTGCQYCGVSYLLLSKYNNIVKHVSKLELELETLKTYATEHPLLSSKHALLEATHQQALETIRELELDASKSREDAGKTIRSLHELQLRHTRLTHDFVNSAAQECAMQRNSWMEDSLRTQMRSLVGSIDFMQVQLRTLKAQVADAKSHFARIIASTVNALKPILQQEAQSLVLSVVESTKSVVAARLSARYAEATKAMTVQLDEMKLDLADSSVFSASVFVLNPSCKFNSDNRNAQLANEIKTMGQQYEEYFRVFRGGYNFYHSSVTQNSCPTETAANDELRNKQELAEVSRKCEELEALATTLQAANKEAVDTLSRERAENSRHIDSLRSRLLQQEQDLQKSAADAQDLRRQLEISATQMETGKLTAQKDLEIHKLTSTVSDLNKIIDSLRLERTKTIEAHQSRVKQLQDKHLEELSGAKIQQKDETVSALRAELDAEKIELLKTQKANFQKQLSELQVSLQSQVDAARLSRDKAIADAKTRIAELEARNAKVTSENEQLKTRILALELKAADHAEPIHNSGGANVDEFEAALARKDAEIAFLKDTVKIECEERMVLLATLDSLKRSGIPALGSRKEPNSQMDSECPKPDPSGLIRPSEQGKDEVKTQYQKLMALASAKKELKLKQAAKKNQL